MKTILALLTMFLLTNCGYGSINNELIGQVKKVVGVTPILCYAYNAADISLGVMRGGVGSMSTQDEWVYVRDVESLKTLKQANETGALVKITYDEVRTTFCVPRLVVTRVEIVK